MTKARKQRLREAWVWFKSQNFTDDSHIVKAYRKQFNVDRTCAMTELCMLKVLSPEKQKMYMQELAAKKRKWQERAERKRLPQSDPLIEDQDENFFFIAGYTPGGAPYGITWEEERRLEEAERLESLDADGDLPFE